LRRQVPIFLGRNARQALYALLQRMWSSTPSPIPGAADSQRRAFTLPTAYETGRSVHPEGKLVVRI